MKIIRVIELEWSQPWFKDWILFSTSEEIQVQQYDSQSIVCLRCCSCRHLLEWLCLLSCMCEIVHSCMCSIKKKTDVEHWFQAQRPGCVDYCVTLLPPKVRVWINWYLVSNHTAYWTSHTENTQLQSQYWHYPCLMSPTSLKTHFKWQNLNREI